MIKGEEERRHRLHRKYQITVVWSFFFPFFLFREIGLFTLAAPPDETLAAAPAALPLTRALKTPPSRKTFPFAHARMRGAARTAAVKGPAGRKRTPTLPGLASWTDAPLARAALARDPDKLEIDGRSDS